ncbi:hypothetical protein V8C86DRAFT_2475827 [Haematococcus lacustris]
MVANARNSLVLDRASRLLCGAALYAKHKCMVEPLRNPWLITQRSLSSQPSNQARGAAWLRNVMEPDAANVNEQQLATLYSTANKVLIEFKPLGSYATGRPQTLNEKLDLFFARLDAGRICYQSLAKFSFKLLKKEACIAVNAVNEALASCRPSHLDSLVTPTMYEQLQVQMVSSAAAISSSGAAEQPQPNSPSSSGGSSSSSSGPRMRAGTGTGATQAGGRKGRAGAPLEASRGSGSGGGPEVVWQLVNTLSAEVLTGHVAR